MVKHIQLLGTARQGFTTISPDRNTVVSFDREGRLFSYVKDGKTYRRTLSSTVEVRWRQGGRQRAQLNEEEALNLFAESYAVAAACRPYADEEIRQRLDTEILRWTPDRLLAEWKRFQQVYRPITILPPDQYLTVVLQATEGCTWNRCTFCSFYQDRPFRVKSESEFARHVQNVRQFFGKGLLMRRGLFLADGNALALSDKRLEPMFHIAREVFPNQDIYSFIDLYTGERRSVDAWRQLKSLGLRRVYIGMETGLDELLGFLNKPGSRSELLQFVRDLKTAGLHIGLIVMVGVGGVEYKKDHAQATLDAIAQMPLEKGDLIYLSPFIEHPHSEYVRRREAASLTPLTEEAIEAETTRFAQRIRNLGFQAARYDIREFMY